MKKKLDIFIEKLSFNDGGSVSLSSDDLVIVVGPNNAGKSSMLRELHSQLNQWNVPFGPVLTGYSLFKGATEEEIWDHVKHVGTPQAGVGGRYNIEGSGVNQETIANFLNARNKLLALPNIVEIYVDASTRLQLAMTQPSIDFGVHPKKHPVHYLFQDPELMGRIGHWFKHAFGTQIAIDHLAGNVIPLHVGPNVERRLGEDLQDQNYRDRLRSSPRLDVQGDGMKGFVGILIHVLSGHQSLFLVDEPEAFLHPPQARLLGRLIAAEKAKGTQVLIATHSADFLRGALEARNASVRVLRIRRHGLKNRVSELSPEAVREVWSDPALRYSNILDGAFHEKVVICEADGDCRFYAAIADALRDEVAHPYLRDVMFTQSGGKGGIPKLILALRRLEVPVAAVVDFDLLSSTGQLRSIIEALGGRWDDYAEDHRTVKASIDELGKVTALDFKTRLQTVVDEIDERADAPTAKSLASLRKLLRTSVGNERAKQAGVGVLSREARPAADRLLAGLMQLGLAIVPSGELESFVASEPAEKNAWVAAVLEQFGESIANAGELHSAREFVAQLIKAQPDRAFPPNAQGADGHTA